MEIANQTKWSTDTFLVSCTGKCKSVYVTLDEGSGDADLYAHYNKINATFKGDCPETKCELCRKRSAEQQENCKINPVGNQFYVSVHAYSSYTNGTLTVKGSNLNQVIKLETFHTTTTTATPTTTPSTTPDPSTQSDVTSSGST